jgi:prolipoprotein diacylglyceryl transferase
VPTVLPILASIPSPSDNAIKIGGLELRAYGLAIALGVIAAVWIARRRWAARGGDPDDISRIALWAVLAGLIGARLYHVITDHDRFEGRWLHAFAVWEGGLGIPGGLIAGVGVGAFVAHRRGLPVAQLLDVVAPALPVAQAIGRLGNWFNQELFGRPTDLPWGLEIDPAHRPAGYLNVATFHPAFLYEALWNLALAGGLVLWERHHPNSRPGRLFALYVAGYAVGRAWVEALRIDPAAHLFGVRWNIWMSFIAFVGAVGWLVFDSWRASKQAGREPAEAAAAAKEVAAGTTSTDAAEVVAADEPATKAVEEPAVGEEAAAAGAAASAEEPAAIETGDEPSATEAGEEPARTEADEPPEEPAATKTPDEAADAKADEEPAATEVTEEPEPVAGDQADTTGAAGPEGQPKEAEVDAEDAATTDTAADAAEQLDAGEPDAGEPDAGEPDAGEPDAAEAAGTGEPVDTDEQADADAGDDAPDTAAETADTAREPTGPAANDPDSDRANTPEPDAGQPVDAEPSHPTDPEPAPEAPAETADEEAAT